MGGFIGSRAKGARGAWLYSLGSLAAGLVYQAFNSWAQLYYVDVLKMPLALYGTAMTFYGIWNAINDPLAGQWSDMTSTRWGRRIPFILFGTVPMCLAFIMVWAVPPAALATPGRLFAYFVITVFLFDGLYSMVVLNWTALYPEMYPELAQRSSVSAIKQALGIVGMVVGMVLAPQFRAALGWTGMGIAFAIMGAAAMYASLAGSQEDPRFSQVQSLGIAQALKSTFINRSFVTYVIANLLVQFTFVLVQAALPFYSKYVIGASDAQNTLILAPMFVVALPMVWAWSRITNRLGPKNAMILSVVLFALGLTPFLFVHSLVGAMATTAFIGVGLSGLLVLVDVLIADVVDEDEVATGRRREGMYFGANAFIIRLGVALQAIVFSAIMAAHGYDPNLATQPQTVIRGLRLIMAGVPILGLVVALLAMRAYPLDAKRRGEIAARIEALRTEQ
ncbi:MAG: MFS transporter [Firmicutes bacterium]|jgi:GPH family glycoside/pentoside/hexuronide:cation symporter|nr:MFS transporter [Bacillota bacterium]